MSIYFFDFLIIPIVIITSLNSMQSLCGKVYLNVVTL